MSTKPQLEAIAADPNASAVSRGAATAWLKIIESGDMQEFTRVLDRTVGKVKEVLDQTITTTDADKMADGIPTKTLMTILRKANKDNPLA